MADTVERKREDPGWLSARINRIRRGRKISSIPPGSGYADLVDHYQGNLSSYLMTMYEPGIEYIMSLQGPLNETKEMIVGEFIRGNKIVIQRIGADLAVQLSRDNPENVDLSGSCMSVVLQVDRETVPLYVRSAKSLKERVASLRADPWEVFLAKYRSRVDEYGIKPLLPQK